MDKRTPTNTSTVYGRAMSRRYDLDFAALFAGADRGDVDFFRSQAARTRGEICEVGAGTGRGLFALGEVSRGRALHGVEPSPWMREAFVANRARLEPEVDARVRLHDGHFGEIPLADDSVGLVYAAFRSFQHVLEVDEQEAGLRAMLRVLEPGGVMAIDLFDPPYALLADTRERLGKRYRTPDGTIVSRYESRRLVREKQRVDVTLRWVERVARGPERGAVVREEVETYGVRYTFPYELLHLVKGAGFVEVELCGGYDGRPLGAVPGELVVTARKR
jgi:ubiquinone/menaquinone biosynthesis C-methylase UbiE